MGLQSKESILRTENAVEDDDLMDDLVGKSLNLGQNQKRKM